VDPIEYFVGGRAMRNKYVFFLASSALACGMTFLIMEAAAAKEVDKNNCVAFSTLYDSKNYPGYAWQTLDNRNFVLLVHGNGQMYHVRVSLPLPALDVARELQFKENGPWLCDMPPSSVVLVGREPPNVSSISSMKHLAQEDIAKLEEEYKTKIAPKKKQ
jgi:hypothetical protein